MKNTALLAIVVCLNFMACRSIHAQDTNKGGNTFNYTHVPANQILPVYKAIAKVELVEASNVQDVHTGITLQTTEPLSQEAAQHLLEQTLLKQAGIVITRLDDKRVSVTYNDQLKLEP